MAYPYKPKSVDNMGTCVSVDEKVARIMQIQLELLQDALSSQSYLWLLEMAEAGDPFARNILYYYLMEHEEMSFDWSKMVKWAREYISEDPAEAFNMLSSIYAPGLPGFEDLELCLRYLELGIDAGSNECVYRLAMIAHDLLPDRYPPERIRGMLENCDLSGAPSSVLMILEAVCRDMGDNVAAFCAARTWQKMYPMEPDSNLVLAYYYANGKGVKRNYKMAMKYYQKAANLGDHRGLFYVGFMHYVGDGCRRNASQAVSYFRKAVQEGSSEAIAPLAKCYLSGEGVRADVERGLELLRTGVEKEIYACCHMLALCYYEGKYVPRDIRQTLELLDLAVRYREEKEVEILDHEIEELKSCCMAELQEELQSAFLPDFLVRWEKVASGGNAAGVDALLIEAAQECPWNEKVQTCISEALEGKSCSAEGRRRVMSILRSKAESEPKVALFIARLYDEGRAIRRNLASAYCYYEKAWLKTASEELAIRIFLRLLDGSLSDSLVDRSKWFSLLVTCYERSPRVNYLRGLMHATGGFLKRSKKIADEFFSRAAEGGFTADPVADARAIRKGTKSLLDCLNLPG